MTSVLTAQPITFPTNTILAQMNTSSMAQPDPTLERRPKMEVEDKNRGRRKSRASKSKEEGGAGDLSAREGEGAEVHSSGSDAANPRKRRRSRRGLSKKFECPQEGCGKSYSRAEHL